MGYFWGLLHCGAGPFSMLAFLLDFCYNYEVICKVRGNLRLNFLKITRIKYS